MLHIHQPLHDNFSFDLLSCPPALLCSFLNKQIWHFSGGKWTSGPILGDIPAQEIVRRHIIPTKVEREDGRQQWELGI